MEIFISKPDRKVYRVGDTIIKEFMNYRDAMNEEWYLYYQDFNNRYNCMPDIIDFEPGHKIVMNYIPGYVLGNIRPTREIISHVVKLYSYFAEYSALIGKDYYHWDIHCDNMIIGDNDKLTLIDPDSISINSPNGMQRAYAELHQFIMSYLLKPCEDRYYDIWNERPKDSINSLLRGKK